MMTVSQLALQECSTNVLPSLGAKITLADSFYKVREEAGSVRICVELKTEIKRDFDFELSFIELTADGT